MESSIKFNAKFCNEIWDETKISTIRLTDEGLKEGDKFKPVFLKDNGEIYEDILSRQVEYKVTGILRTQVKYLDHYDAFYDGFDSLYELYDDLTKYYPDLRLNDTIYIIYFKKEE